MPFFHANSLQSAACFYFGRPFLFLSQFLCIQWEAVKTGKVLDEHGKIVLLPRELE